MHFSTLTVFTLTALSAALPTAKRQAGAAVFSSTTYDAISISGGTAGNGEAEALAVFSALDNVAPADVTEDDLDFLNEVNQVANDAETEAFNPAIEAATGAEKDALSAGKTKNKILKLMATKLKLEAQEAQGEDVATKLAEELKKLNTNIAADEKNAGETSTAVSLDATIAGAGSAAASSSTGATGASKASGRTKAKTV